MKVTKAYVKRYVKHLFGTDIKVKFQRHFHSRCYGMADYDTHSITLSNHILEDFEKQKAVIWHEVGHLRSNQNHYFSVIDEVLAQTWVLNEAKKRGYTRLYEDFIDYVRGWQHYPELSKQHQTIYGRASYQILKAQRRRTK